jgi:hypothetical protein
VHNLLSTAPGQPKVHAIAVSCSGDDHGTGGGLSILIDNANHTDRRMLFQPPVTAPVLSASTGIEATSPGRLAIADLDGDGDAEIAVVATFPLAGGTTQRTVQVLRNDLLVTENGNVVRNETVSFVPQPELPHPNPSEYSTKFVFANNAGDLFTVDSNGAEDPVILYQPGRRPNLTGGVQPPARCSPADIAGGGADGRSPDGIVDGSDFTLFINSFSSGDLLADIFVDGTIDGSDFIAFINSFATGDVAVDPIADVNQDGTIDGNDYITFINAFSAGC